MIERSALLRELLIATKDGDWGESTPREATAPYRVIRGADFPRARVGDLSEVPLRFLRIETVGRRTLEQDDILIETAGGSHDRPTGRTLLITERILDSFDSPVTCASFCRFLRVDRNKIDPRYLYWYLQHIYQQGIMWEHQVQHTGIARFQFTKFAESVRVPLPTPAEQEAIIQTLSSLDNKIELNRRINQTLEAIARAIFKSWFVDFEPICGNKPYTFTSANLPEGWSLRKLDSVVLINERILSRDYARKSIEYVDISSVSRGRLGETTPYRTNEAPSRARNLTASGDTIWSCVRPNRRSYLYVHEPPDNMVVSTGFAVLTPKRLPPSYLYAWVTTDSFVDYLESNADGSAYPAVRPSHFGSAEILLPPEDLLSCFHETAGPIREKIAANDSEARTLASLRDALLPKLLSGEIRIKQAEKIVGEVV